MTDTRTPGPQQKPASRKLAVLAGVSGLSVAVAAGLVNPTTSTLPQCPVHALSGLSCPGCGATRALHAIAGGDVVQALNHNAFFVVAVALLTWSWVVYVVRAFAPNTHLKIKSPFTYHKLWWVGALAIGVFTVTRNLPFAAPYLAG